MRNIKLTEANVMRKFQNEMKKNGFGNFRELNISVENLTIFFDNYLHEIIYQNPDRFPPNFGIKQIHYRADSILTLKEYFQDTICTLIAYVDYKD